MGRRQRPGSGPVPGFCAERIEVPEEAGGGHLPCPEPHDPDSLYCRFHRPAYTTRSTR